MKLNFLTNIFDRCDALAHKQIESLHFNGDKKHKSSVGGFCTICLISFLIVLTVWKGAQIFQFDGTYNYEGTLSHDEEIFLNESSLKF
jgi:hypothetical protein